MDSALQVPTSSLSFARRYSVTTTTIISSHAHENLVTSQHDYAQSQENNKMQRYNYYDQQRNKNNTPDESSQQISYPIILIFKDAKTEQSIFSQLLHENSMLRVFLLMFAAFISAIPYLIFDILVQHYSPFNYWFSIAIRSSYLAVLGLTLVVGCIARKLIPKYATLTEVLLAIEFIICAAGISSMYAINFENYYLNGESLLPSGFIASSVLGLLFAK